ncbi:hypothetical protein WCLP8_890004 [uncultured Gammaproteobacteria bacterium]
MWFDLYELVDVVTLTVQVGIVGRLVAIGGLTDESLFGSTVIKWPLGCNTTP